MLVICNPTSSSTHHSHWQSMQSLHEQTQFGLEACAGLTLIIDGKDFCCLAAVLISICKHRKCHQDAQTYPSALDSVSTLPLQAVQNQPQACCYLLGCLGSKSSESGF